mmetsp:Transcript_19993/g.33578  ORF Transcript_19993/g.33578 Transcript_19993/m.33578 type:complete len:365 (-) Transcript_19993:536-1630(-)
MRRPSLVVLLTLLTLTYNIRSVEASLFLSTISARDFVKHVRGKFWRLQQARQELDSQRTTERRKNDLEIETIVTTDGFSNTNESYGSSFARHTTIVRLDGSRRLSQSSRCVTLEAELIELGDDCEGAFQELDCAGPVMLDVVCPTMCIARVLSKYEQFFSSGCTTSYSMDVESRLATRLNFGDPTLPQCTYDRDCCPDEVCSNRTCTTLPDEGCKQSTKGACHKPFANLAEELTIRSELVLGELLCSRTDDSGAFCAQRFFATNTDDCLLARGLGCCAHTMDFFAKSCGFNNTFVDSRWDLGATVEKCGMTKEICKNVDVDVKDGICHPLPHNTRSAHGGLVANAGAAALVLISVWASVHVTHS